MEDSPFIMTAGDMRELLKDEPDGQQLFFCLDKTRPKHVTELVIGIPVGPGMPLSLTPTEVVVIPKMLISLEAGVAVLMSCLPTDDENDPDSVTEEFAPSVSA